MKVSVNLVARVDEHADTSEIDCGLIFDDTLYGKLEQKGVVELPFLPRCGDRWLVPMAEAPGINFYVAEVTVDWYCYHSPTYSIILGTDEPYSEVSKLHLLEEWTRGE